jgi:hypothetical protein
MTRSARSGTRRSERVRCAIYTRKSSEEGLEQEFNSLQAQRDACEAFINSQRHEGWTCLRAAYDDGGFSGGTMDRPALHRLLADITMGRVDTVVRSDGDLRPSRDRPSQVSSVTPDGLDIDHHHHIWYDKTVVNSIFTLSEVDSIICGRALALDQLLHWLRQKRDICRNQIDRIPVFEEHRIPVFEEQCSEVQ